MWLQIDAPGYSGDYVTVWGVAHSKEKAWELNKRGGKSVQVVECADGLHEKGDKISRGVVDQMLAAGRWRAI